MFNSVRFKIILILLIGNILQPIFSEAANFEPQFEYMFDIGGEPGYITIQDKDGFLWFSSFYNGMLRFDGSSKMSIREGAGRLSSDFVTQLFEDRDGFIWAGTNYGLNRYDKETNTITQFFYNPDAPDTSLAGNIFNLSSTTIIQDRNGNLWFGTQSGLSKYDQASGTFTNYRHDADDPFSISDNNIYSVFEDSDGLIWVGTKDHGVNSFNQDTDRFTRYMHDPENPDSFPEDIIRSVLQDKKGDIWFATLDNGLIRRNQKTGQFSHFKHDPENPASLLQMSITNFTMLKDGRFVLNSDSSTVGLIIFDPLSVSYEQYEKEAGKLHSLSANTVMGTFEDRDGTLWFIYNNGKVDKYDPQSRRFALYQHNPLDETSLGGHVAAPVYQDIDGRIWIGLFGEGMDLYNPDTDDFTHNPSIPGDPKTLPHGYPAGFYESSRGEFFVSTAAGLVSFDPVKKEVIKKYTSDTWYYVMIEDHEDPDVIWAVGWEQSFQRLNLRTGERQIFRNDPDDPDSFSAVTSVRFIRDKDDPEIFWIATWGGGLEKFDRRTSSFIHHKNDPEDKNTISSNTVYDLMEDSRGNFWVSTDKGLNKFDKGSGTFIRFGWEQGFDAKLVHNILEDRSGRLWMGTNIGLIVFDIETETVLKVYTVEDGLHSHDFFPSARGKTRDGQLWFSGFNGMNRFNPEELVENPNPPQIFLTSIKQNGQEWMPPTAFEYLDEIHLGWNDNFFEFEYVALNYTGSSKNQYKYMLEGYDRDWFDGGTRQFGRYTGLPGGTYTLRVLGTNNDGVWCLPEQEVSLKVIVSAPPWLRWWAIILYILAVLSVVVSVFYFRTRILMKQKLLLQKNVDDRTKELALLNVELNDTVQAQIFAAEIAKLAYWELNLQNFEFTFNDRFYSLLNTTVDQEGGYVMSAERYFTNFVHPEDITLLQEKIQNGKSSTEEHTDQFEYRIITRDSIQQNAFIKYKVILNEGHKAVKTFGIHMDITDQKKVEQALELAKEEAEAATRAKSDFLANMSHEIRTPMNAIIGLDHLLLRTKLDVKQKDYADKISGAARNLLGIINDILDFSKIEAGKLDIESISFNLNEVMKTLSDMIGDKASSKGLELIFNQDTEIPDNLMGDPLRLGQILLNLTNNAVKFTEKGEIEVSTKLLRQDSSGAMLRFEIRDSGIGLTKEEIGKLFQSFSQADTSTTRKYGGTGLGLTISKHLSHMMGGEIGVESEYGQGSTFFFTAQLGIGKDKKREKLIAPEDLKGLEVLVVDDNATSREVLSAYLTEMNFQVTAVESGELALREIIKFKAENDKAYDLVLMDYQMPGMNGIETSVKIQTELENVEVPQIVMVTSFGREEIIKQADSVGLDGFLIKPVSPSTLFDTIMDVFGKGSKISKLEIPDDNKPEGFELVRGGKLLLIEDNEINQQVAQELLEQEGFFVDIAENGLIGIEKALSATYDLILMDLQMPVMGGYEATIGIREKQSKEELPIIAMTADAMTGVQDKVLKAGMNDYITKPINTKRLWATLARWIPPGERPLPPHYSAHDRSHADESGDISIPGIDTIQGLKRVGQNRGLYLKLLRQFTLDYRDFYNDLIAMIERGDIDEAIRTAHTLKGVSGNIGIESLQEQAASLESSLKDQGDWKPVLKKNADLLNEITMAIQDSKILHETETSGEGKPITREELITQIQKMIEALKIRKPKPALEILESLSRFTHSPETDTVLNNCRDLLSKYKMKDALSVLKELVE
jgi:two-component system, sensor histidine kinase and response regulator